MSISILNPIPIFTRYIPIPEVNMSQQELDVAYDKYYDFCELNNISPLPYSEWLAQF